MVVRRSPTRFRRRSIAARPATIVLGVGAVLGAAAAGPLSATASARATTFTINGGGAGSGIGMSQYGALGFALHHYSDRRILGHYYSGTTLGRVSPNETITVLLGVGSAGFRGAKSVDGHSVDPSTTYSVRTDRSELKVMAGSRTIGTFRAPLTVRGSKTIDATGFGEVDGALVFRPQGSQVETVNAVGLDDYVAGVVAEEMPSSWPAAALEAQAVAARTYALTAGAASPDFDVYPDTRSQVYGGLAAETPSTDAAVTATRGEIVEYHGAPAFTPYFASSGGYTESIQNVWLGASPDPWLRGVPDPYDDSGDNPEYRWTMRMSMSAAAARLSGYVRGRFEGVTITKRGVSKRVVDAEVDGSGGKVAITGPDLQDAFGTLSTLMTFSTS